MAKKNNQYNRSDLVRSLNEIGVNSRDIIFSHVGLGWLGNPSEGSTIETACDVLMSAFREVIGPQGTWLVPTYSYSYCKGAVYDPETTPSDLGSFSNYFRKYPDVQRSRDPIFSVAGLGPHVSQLFADLPQDCFGANSLYGRLEKAGAKICNVGMPVWDSTFVHHVEQTRGVPYRYSKRFLGKTVTNGSLVEEEWNYNVRSLLPNCFPNLEKLEGPARDRGLVQDRKVGRGEINIISCKDMKSLCLSLIDKDEWFLAKGPPVYIFKEEETMA